MKNKSIALALLTSSVLVAACGGGGGGSAAPASSTSSGNVSGVAAKGLLKKAKVTAYCGEELAANKLGETTTADTTTTNANGPGFYSIPFSASCTKPVKVVVEKTTGTTMLDEATNSELPVPDGFKLRAYVADPATTSVQHVTPFTDMAASLVDREGTGNLSKTTVQLATAAVTTTVLGGNSQAMTAKPIALSDLAKADDSQQKLALLLTAVSAYAGTLADDPTCGTQDKLVCALGKLTTQVTSSVTELTASGYVVPTSATSSPVADTLATALTTVDTTGWDTTVASTFTAETTEVQSLLSEASTATTTIATTGGTQEVATTALTSIEAAKKMFADLRTDVVSLSNSAKTGFVDVKLAAVRDDMRALQGQFDVKDAIEAISAAATAIEIQAVPWENQLPYAELACALNTVNTAICTSREYQSYSWDGVTHRVNFIAVRYTVTKGATGYTWSSQSGTSACSYTWDSTLNQSVANCVDTLTSPLYAGSFSAPFNASGDPIAFTVTGDVPPTVGVTGKTVLSLTVAQSGLGDATATAGAKSISLTGSVIAKDAAGATLSKLELLSGTEIKANLVATTGGMQTQMSSMAFKGRFETANFRFDGTVTVDNFKPDQSGLGIYIPWHAAFQGTVGTLANGVATAFLDGRIDLSVLNDGGYNSLVSGTQDSWLGKFLFDGKVINGATTYNTVLTLEDQTLSTGTVALTYAKNGANYLTATGTYDDTVGTAADSRVKFTQVGSNISVELVKNLGTDTRTMGKVFDGTTQIGTIADNRVTFSDGTYIVIL